MRRCAYILIEAATVSSDRQNLLPRELAIRLWFAETMNSVAERPVRASEGGACKREVVRNSEVRLRLK